MSEFITNFDGRVYISPSIENDDLDLAGFQAISGWIELPEIGNVDQTGNDQNVVTYPVWGSQAIRKGKGQVDAGSPTIECLDVASAGRDAWIAAAEPSNQNNYGVAIEWSNGTIEYNRGLIMGPIRLKGGNEDFKRLQFICGFQQPAVEDNVSSSL